MIEVEVVKGQASVVNLTCAEVGVKIGIETRGYLSQTSLDKLVISISLKFGSTSKHLSARASPYPV